MDHKYYDVLCTFVFYYNPYQYNFKFVSSMKILSSEDDISGYVERQNKIEEYFCSLMLFSMIRLLMVAL